MAVRPEILAKHEELHELCRRSRVKCLDVYGSAATDRFDPAPRDVEFVNASPGQRLRLDPPPLQDRP